VPKVGPQETLPMILDKGRAPSRAKGRRDMRRENEKRGGGTEQLVDKTGWGEECA
jgi:hypothetical protein